MVEVLTDVLDDGVSAVQTSAKTRFSTASSRWWSSASQPGITDAKLMVVFLIDAPLKMVFGFDAGLCR